MKGRFFAVLLLTQVGSGTSGASPTPDDYLERGNALIAAQSWTECQALFEEALQEDAENLVYRSQLGLCLTGRGEYEGAAEQLRQVLAVDPENAGALWYLAVNRHLARDHRAAIYQLQLVEPRLEPQAPTRAALLWYLGQSYKALLSSEGLAPEEIDAMASAFERFFELQPGTEGRSDIEAWLEWVENNRPTEGSGKKWLALPTAPELEAVTTEEAALGPGIDEADLPDPEPGFVWRRLPDFGVAFQMPEAWHFKKEVTDQARAFFMTKEDIDESGHFLTGLTLNLVLSAQERTGKSAVEYAEQFVALACTEGTKLDAWQRRVGVLRSFACTVARVEGERSIVVHHLAIGNERTDTLFIVLFESPVESWQVEWEAVGSKMLAFFAIDDEI